MFSKLPDLLDRNFFIGFMLPGFILIVAVSYILQVSAGWHSPLFFLESEEKIFDTTMFAVVVWLSGLLLMVLNRPIIRTMEGYTFKEIWGFGWRLKYWKKRFNDKVKPSLDEWHDPNPPKKADGKPDRSPGFAGNLLRAVEGFPHREALVLPTAFGNRFRAIEAYSIIVYGLDAIQAWGRLEALIPEAYQAKIAEKRALLDFTANLYFIGTVCNLLLTFLLAFTLTSNGPQFSPFVNHLIFLLLVAFAATELGYLASLSTLSEFGLYIMSAFDLYRHKLAEQMKLSVPVDPVEEKKMWKSVSKMMTFHSGRNFEELAQYKEREEQNHDSDNKEEADWKSLFAILFRKD